MTLENKFAEAIQKIGEKLSKRFKGHPDKNLIIGYVTGLIVKHLGGNGEDSEMKTEIDYVVKQHLRNGMIVLAKYTDRMKMLHENPNVDRTKFIVIEDDKTFCRYNEVDGKEMLWKGMPDIEEAAKECAEQFRQESLLQQTSLLRHCCPICGGNGLVPGSFYTTLWGGIGTSTSVTEKCRSCEGKGILWG